MNNVDIIDTVKYTLMYDTNYHIQYKNNKINAITAVRHKIENFAKSQHKILNKLMIITYCIYDQCKIKRKKPSNCWLCGFDNNYYTEYQTIFDNYINLHKACFEECYNMRKNTNYHSLSIFKNEDYHCLKYFDKYIVYNETYLHYIYYEEHNYIPYPNLINNVNFHDEYKKWSLKFLVKQNIPKLLYFKKYLNHDDIFKYIMMIYAKEIIDV
jgi:hypothetical protein